MTLEALQKEMIAAMKAKDKVRKDAISNLIAAVKKYGIDNGVRNDITEEMTDAVILKELKAAKEQIDTCPKERTDLIEEYTAKYVAARNENIIVGYPATDCVKTHFSMMTMDTNKEVYDILNNAIKAMKEDGTLDSLIESELKAYINSDPEPKDLPHFDGARTIKIGVTGDIPPMDFVAANGKAAGFNIALLTEIANRAQVNIELVHIEADARAMALSSNKVDAVFWTKSATCTVCNATATEKIDGTIVTESYYSDYTASIRLKSDK